MSQILEAGPHSLNVDTHVQPARYVHNLFNPNQSSKSFTLHVAQATEAVANRNVIVPAGRVLGGGSSVNCEYYLPILFIWVKYCAQSFNVL